MQPLLQSHAFLLGTNNQSPVVLDAAEGYLELHTSTIIFHPAGNQLPLILEISAIHLADFTKISGDPRLQFVMANGMVYTFSFNEMFTLGKNIKRALFGQYFSGSYAQLEIGLNEYVAWERALLSILPPERIKIPSLSPAFKHIMITIAVVFGFIVFLFFAYAMAWI